jgi:alpha-beta hydrolase superfamily lysophospholipase
MAKNKNMSLSNFSDKVQKLIIEQFGIDFFSVSPEGVYEFMDGKIPTFKDFSDKVKSLISEESKARKLAAQKQKQKEQEAKAKEQEELKLKERTDEFKALHLLSFGQMPEEFEVKAFQSMRKDGGKDLSESSFESLGMKIDTITYEVMPKEYRRSKRDAFNSVVPSEIGVEKDKNNDVLLVGARAEFLKNLAKNHSEALLNAGMPQEQIDDMREQGIGPAGYNVHHKLPIHGGGGNDESNFVLIRDTLYHDMIHAFADPQISGMKEGDKRQIRMPAPKDNVVFYDNPSNVVTKEQTNEAIKSKKVVLNKDVKKTKRNPDFTQALSKLSEQEIKDTVKSLEKHKLNIHKGNDGTFEDINNLISKCKLEYQRRVDKDIEKHQLNGGNNVYYQKFEGREPGIVCIHGTHGSMDGVKVQHLKKYCKEKGLAFLALDLPGHKRSTPPEYKDCDIGKWSEAAAELIEKHTTGKQVVVGSSMGGWVAANVAAKMPEKISSVVGLAAAFDYTMAIEGKLSAEQKKEIAIKGATKFYTNPKDNEGMLITKTMIQSGRKYSRLSKNSKPLEAPLLLIQGTKDNIVPKESAEMFKNAIRTTQPVEVKFVEGASHGLGRPNDLEVLTKSIDKIIEKQSTKSSIKNVIMNKLMKGRN